MSSEETNESPEMEEIKSLIKQGRKIEAIKQLRESTGHGLKEAKETVEAIQVKLVELGEMEPPKTSGCAGAALFLLATGAAVGYQLLS